MRRGDCKGRGGKRRKEGNGVEDWEEDRWEEKRIDDRLGRE
jgi:hypothetical protein